MGERSAKRVVFDHSDYNDLLGKIQSQIEVKQQNTIGEKQLTSD